MLPYVGFVSLSYTLPYTLPDNFAQCRILYFTIPDTSYSVSARRMRATCMAMSTHIVVRSLQCAPPSNIGTPSCITAVDSGRHRTCHGPWMYTCVETQSSATTAGFDCRRLLPHCGKIDDMRRGSDLQAQRERPNDSIMRSSSLVDTSWRSGGFCWHEPERVSAASGEMRTTGIRVTLCP